MKYKFPSLFTMIATVTLFVNLSAAPPSIAQEGIPAPNIDQTSASGHQIAVLAGGCFWGVQGVFQHIQGIENAVSGYAGGDIKPPITALSSAGTPGMQKPCKSPITPTSSAMVKFCKFTFQ